MPRRVTAAETMRRLAAARIVAARAALAPRTPGDDDVHDARRELRRARALLGLLRDALDRDDYRWLDRQLRDVGRHLGPARDAAALAGLARAMARTAALDAAALRPLVAPLDRARRAERGRVDRRGARALLAAAGRRLAAARLEVVDEALADGFMRLYRRGRRALAAAGAQPRPARLHEWRKQARRYWFVLEVLEPAWPRLVTALAREAHHLADLLGADHDAALLRRRLAAAPLAPTVRRRLAAALAARRVALRAEAFALGARLYGGKPHRVATRAASWWAGWAPAAGAATQRGRLARGRAS